MNTFIRVILGLLLLSGCTTDKKLYVILEDAQGFSEESQLLVNGYVLGSLDNMSLMSNGYVVSTVNLKEDFDLPKDSKFFIHHRTLLGDKDLEVNLGSSEIFLSDGDTVKAILDTNTSDLEKASVKTLKAIARAFDGKKGISKKNGLIDFSSMGGIRLCEKFTGVPFEVIRDTTLSSDGLHFYGKYFKSNFGLVLGEISSSDSLSISSLYTTSKKLKTIDGIGVSSSLLELINADPNILITSVTSGYDDLYLFHTYKDVQVEYRLSSEGMKLIKDLTILDDHYRLLDFKDIEIKIEEAGLKANHISSITVQLLGNCAD